MPAEPAGTRSSSQPRARAASAASASAGQPRSSGLLERGSRRHEVAQLLDPRRPDAGDRVEVVDRAQRPVRLAPVEDLLRRHRPDPGQRVELVERRAREAHLRRAARAAASRRPRPGATRAGTTICCPSATGAARLTSVRSAPGSGRLPARARRRRGLPPAGARALRDARRRRRRRRAWVAVRASRGLLFGKRYGLRPVPAPSRPPRSACRRARAPRYRRRAGSLCAAAGAARRSCRLYWQR